MIQAQAEDAFRALYLLMPFEDYNGKPFHFILVSHVLQYIDTDVRMFIKKIYQSLCPGGLALIVQQTKIGIAQLIKHQKQYLSNPRFQNWLTFEDYLMMIEELGLPHQVFKLNCNIEGLDFSKPSPNDKKWLEFVFCLDDFDNMPSDFQSHLSDLGKIDLLPQGNGIIVL